MGLCSRCAKLDFGLLIERACIEAEVDPASADSSIPDSPIIENLSFAALSKAAIEGCDLCSLIRHGLIDQTSARPAQWTTHFSDDALLVVSIVRERCHPDLAPVLAQCCALHVKYSTEGRLPEEAWIELSLVSDVSSRHVSAKRSPWNPSLWCSWKDACLKTHEKCNALKQNQYAPTRLIDVASVSTTPKLTETCGIPAEYVALSHCWGGSLPLRTTTANFQDHLSAVPWELIPATFRDAIRVTRALGYRYLWIDCLCIIQDSEEDWLRECALMGDVYANAALTIAAEQSDSPSSGIFEDLYPPSYTCSVPVQWASTGKSGTLFIGLPSNPRIFHSRSFLYGPLSQRGWALQERVLSRRVLHMSGGATCFICSCSESADCLPWPMPLHDSHYRMTLPHHQDTAQASVDWFMLVESYTERHLTNERDRLPAISGIARILAERLGWKYVAGLWSHNLEAELMWWSLEPDRPLAINPAKYSGPSWSWASANRRIHYDPAPVFGKRHARSWIKTQESLFDLQNHDWASHYEVLHSSVELVGDDPFAEVKAGQLTISGNLRPIPLPAMPDSLLHIQSLVCSSKVTVNINYRPDVIEPGTEPDTDSAKTWCLLAGFSKFQTWHKRLPICHAFVLEAVPGSPHTFRRVGMMTFECSAEDGGSWDTAVDWLLAAETKEIYLV